MKNGAGKTHGARAYPDDPSGEGSHLWVAREDWQRLLEAGRNNAPIALTDEEAAGLVKVRMEVTSEGLKQWVEGLEIEVVINGEPTTVLVAAGDAS